MRTSRRVTAVRTLVLLAFLFTWLQGAGGVEAALPTDSPSTLTLVGSRSASVDLMLTKHSKRPAGGIRMSGGGTYVGVCLKALDSPRPTACAITIKRFSTPQRPVRFGPIDDVVPAGRYRLMLITDARATVTMPLTGLYRSARMFPARRVSAAIQLSAPSPSAYMPVLRQEWSVARSETTTIALGVRWRGDAPVGATSVNLCIVAGGTCVGQADGDSEQAIHWESGWTGEVTRAFGDSVPITSRRAIVELLHGDVAPTTLAFLIKIDG